MGDERHTMMLALDVDPMGGGDWRWRWYDHDSGRTLADGVEGDVVAAWRAATTHHVKSSNELLWSLDDRAEAAEQRAEAWRWFAQEVASDMHPIGADPLGDITTDLLPALLDITRRAAQQQGADCARAETAEQRAEAAEREVERLRARLRDVGQTLIAEVGAAGPTDAEDVAHAAVARIQAAEAEVARLRAAIAETLRLANIYAGVAAHNAKAEPETAGEAWRSPYMATMRELRRALGGAA